MNEEKNKIAQSKSGNFVGVRDSFKSCVRSLIGPFDEKYVEGILRKTGFDVTDSETFHKSLNFLMTSLKRKEYPLPSLEDIAQGLISEEIDRYMFSSGPIFGNKPLFEIHYPLTVPTSTAVYFPERTSLRVIWTKGKYNPLIHNFDAAYQFLDGLLEQIKEVWQRKSGSEESSEEHQYLEGFRVTKSQAEELQKQELYLDSLTNIPPELNDYGRDWAEILQEIAKADKNKNPLERRVSGYELSDETRKLVIPVKHMKEIGRFKFLFGKELPAFTKDRKGMASITELGGDYIKDEKHEGRPFLRVPQVSFGNGIAVYGNKRIHEGSSYNNECIVLANSKP